jgi:flagellar operon protein
MVNRTGSKIETGIAPVKQKPGWVDQKGAVNKAGDISFHQMLDQVKGRQEVTFSAHARERIESRKIEFKAEDLFRIEEAMDRAQAKGSRSSLLLFGEVALVASVTNRTIITAVDGTENREQIFTGIDSAVILK